jgi:hypothetical protein
MTASLNAALAKNGHRGRHSDSLITERKQTMSNQPTHRIFGVSKPQGATKAIWREIGAAWPHRNGGGLEIALRIVTPRKAPVSTFEGEVA